MASATPVLNLTSLFIFVCENTQRIPHQSDTCFAHLNSINLYKWNAHKFQNTKLIK